MCPWCGRDLLVVSQQCPCGARLEVGSGIRIWWPPKHDEGLTAAPPLTGRITPEVLARAERLLARQQARRRATEKSPPSPLDQKGGETA